MNFIVDYLCYDTVESELKVYFLTKHKKKRFGQFFSGNFINLIKRNLFSRYSFDA